MKRLATMLLLLVCAVSIGACGSQGITVAKTNPYYSGAVLFRDHCSGCHSLSVVGASGSANSIANRVKNQGPNFNIRKENAEQVLYAIRNGGFSGAIMPENIVVGPEAQAVANFLAQYSGLKKQSVPSVNITQSEAPAGEQGKGGTPGEAGKGEAGGTGATSGGASTSAGATPGSGGAKSKTAKKPAKAK
ncbi:MAG: c-type cytochrome [Solirubrobacteraceae bacterium]